MDTLAQLAGPLIALLGTLTVALLAFYQWRKQHDHPSRTANADARRKAHEALWQKLEEINLKLRNHPCVLRSVGENCAADVHRSNWRARFT